MEYGSRTGGVYNAAEPGYTDDTLRFVTIASTGNATDFGTINSVKARQLAQGSNQTRGILAGG